MINYQILLFFLFYFLLSNAPQKWQVLFFTYIKLVACVLAYVHMQWHTSNGEDCTTASKKFLYYPLAWIRMSMPK